ncbi:RES domain-containing protein [Streptomyces sp. NPDC005925]|uniref:RES domain-containing protein n=1 Tax=Streptomyces sp. NPDC005925 TaxID=3157172 RepID=UPI0033DD1728
MTLPPVTLRPAPEDGVWRLGLAHDPLVYNQVEPETVMGSAAGRFSLFSYGMLYCASAPAGCYAEALAPFRVDPRVRDLMGDAATGGTGLMAVGDLASSWRAERILVRLVPSPQARFLDVETEQTRRALAALLKDELRELNLQGPLENHHIHGPNRGIARQIAAWAVAQRNSDGHQSIQGITYRSSYGRRQCWAILRDTELKEEERRPIRLEDVDLHDVAREYGLTVR